ncbi:helix-turn-helix domain-containing protein [Catellatospora paridis]|uniref:helix-turn-helix domain-containing protein n=1 Tax=Catellatospora paridis TaxID=1617086 RepID=UPI0012D3ED90|nr:helix-turn-helix transcriptional regulator [Catellatospora paridis]
MRNKGVSIAPGGLQQARGAIGVSRKRLAELAGITRQSIDNYEQGRSCPYPAKLARLEGVLGKQAVLALIADGEEQQRYLHHPTRFAAIGRNRKRRAAQAK